MIRGSALETTVLARIATNMPSSSPDSASRISRWDIAGVAPPGWTAGWVVLAIGYLSLGISLPSREDS